MAAASDAASLIRDARRRHRLDQRTLARRAGTSQTQVSRIERGEISPSVATLSRLLEAMGERLELVAARGDPGLPRVLPAARRGAPPRLPRVDPSRAGR